MPQTLIEKILSAHSQDTCRAGQQCQVKVDFCFSGDNSAEQVIKALEGKPKPIVQPKKYALVLDHYSPAPNIEAATIHSLIRNFSSKNKNIFFEAGEGIAGQLFFEQGFVKSGSLIATSDFYASSLASLGVAVLKIGSAGLANILTNGYSFFITPFAIKVKLEGKIPKGVLAKDIILKLIKDKSVNYKGKAIEFCGKAVDLLSSDSLWSLCGASDILNHEFVFAVPDKKIKKQVKFFPDRDACYEKEITIDVSDLSPLVCLPKSEAIEDAANLKGVTIQEAFVGGPSNARLEDLEITAKILQGRQVNKAVKLFIAPGSRQILLKALDKGFVRTIINAGSMLLPVGCGPSEGNHQGIPADKETVISTADSNKGAMGNPLSSVYLASTATVVASAVRGSITDPKIYL